MTLYDKLQMINLKIKLENAVYVLIQTKIKEKLYDEDFRHEEMILKLEQARVDNQLDPYIKPNYHIYLLNSCSYLILLLE